MQTTFEKEWKALKQVKERDKIGVWGFGNVSRDVVLYLVEERLGKEIVFYGRPIEEFPNRASAWIEDLKANTVYGPRIIGTNRVEDMGGLDVIFVGVGVPRKKGQTRSDLVAVNAQVVGRTCLEIRDLYKDCPESNLPVLVFMGNPITTVTWLAHKVTGFPRSLVMGQAGNLDSRRICRAIALEIGLSGNDMRGIVFGDHGDTMVVSPRYFSIGGVPLADIIRAKGVDPSVVTNVIEDAKRRGTHFVMATGQSASAGPAKAAGAMLRCIVSGEPEVQPVVAVIEKEYDLLRPEDGLDSMGFGVPARVGSHGVERIYELDVTDIRDAILRSAASIKEDIRSAARVLREDLGLKV